MDKPYVQTDCLLTTQIRRTGVTVLTSCK